jgi:ankyrin repeat protein
MRATINGHIETVKLLLDKGANVNARNAVAETALTHASQKGNTEIVKLLLSKGADVNAKDDAGWTALMWGNN